MTRDEFAKQFVEGAASRGAKKEDIAKILPQALTDFDKQNPQTKKSNPLLDLLGIDANKFQQGQETINSSNANPLLKGAATAQNAIANSGQILPSIYAGVARAAIPIPGLSSGAGAAFGQRLQQMNQRGGVESVLPTQQESNQAATTGLGYGATDLLATALGQAVKKVAKPAGAMIKNPLPGGAGKNVGRAAEAATQEGKQIGWDSGDNNLVSQIRDAVEKKYGSGKAVRDATNTTIAELTKAPPTVQGEFGPQIGETQFTPNDLLQTRSQIQAKSGPAIFSAMKGGSAALEDKINAITRNVISQNLHKLAPETLPPDIALSIYHKLGILGKLGLPGVLGEALLGKTIANKGVNLLQSIGIGQ